MDVEKNTEEKIKEAARKVFQNKGFAGARTRDIAQEAGINLALLNYYFRSKEKLFSIIMLESLQGFVGSIKTIINNADTSFEEKITSLVDTYITMLTINPNLPIFILNEIRVHPEKLINSFDLTKIFSTSVLSQQFNTLINSGSFKNINPIHLLLNVIGLTVFPFVAKPLISSITNVSDTEYLKLMEERKVFIPEWIFSQIKNH